RPAFAGAVRRCLRDNPRGRVPRDGMDAGYGSGAHSRAFMRALAERGWISMCWPEAYGGQARPMFFKLVLFEELALAGAPFGPLAGSWQTADAIIEYGSERLRRDVLPAVARGEATFWQGYSEPDAGSDLLALKTEARRDGDHYVIRGHKIWSSHAGIATHGLVFTRTSREARRSRGFSMFVVPNGTPGMDIRPIRSLTGGVYHYEVFLDDVRVPVELMLGPEGEGFQALLNGLDSDRFWGRFYKAPALERVLRRLVDHANTTGAGRDAVLRRRLAAMAAEIAALRLLFLRAACLLRDGAPISYETAVAKVYADETGQKLARLGMDLLGPWAPLRSGSREALDARGVDDALWRRMAELGWQGLLMPADFGGSDGSLLDVILLTEELGRAVAPGPFVPSAVVATSALLAAGTADQKKRLLPAMAAGERIVGVALASAGNSCEIDARGRLTGRALFVEAAHVADALVVGARAGGDTALLLVPTDRRGIARWPLETIGLEKRFEVAFDDVAIGTDDRLEPAGARRAALAAGALAHRGDGGRRAARAR